MKTMSEIREKTPKELRKVCLELSQEIFDMRNEISLNKKTDKPHLIKEMKRKRARVLTALSEKEGM